VHFTPVQVFSDNSVYAVCAESHDDLWAATGAGPVVYLTGTGGSRFVAVPGLPPTPVTALIPSAAGGHWLATQDGRVLREQKGEFTTLEMSREPDAHPVLAM